MTTLLTRMSPSVEVDATPEDSVRRGAGFVDCRGYWQTLEVEEPVDAGS